ncbi:RHS repeat-associated core domain-containing protein [Fulvivirga sp. 29W222]|uniref:RHS repeat-associated core domain-containing protein n=1 Tax=Fulvivirga marina TaxID=2494733 RepID=A0A937G3J6_9BACT|nr:RHS repeat-associated core domain-containing protein [Fulvivirga marina]
MQFNSYQRVTNEPNKFLYNGKELEDETGNYDYGWRRYDPATARFTGVDAFADKYFSMSPYQYGANNPIKYVDINGDSLMLFKNGAYVATVDNGKEEITGYNQLSEADEDGNESFTGGYHFGFNDIETDKEGLKSGKMKVELISNSEIESTIDASGANDPKNQDNRYSFIHRESRFQHDGSKGKMDFWASGIIRGDNVLHVARSKAGGAVGYNPSDFGNFMWGMAGRRLWFNLTTLRLGAHYNNMMNGKEDNAWNPSYEHQLLDSKADQRAIINGYNYNYKFQKNAVVLPKG